MQNNVFSNRIVGHRIIKLNKVDSTNNYLKNLLSNSKPLKEGTVILTDSQYGGRGQQENKWLSEPRKNLTFSIHLQPHFLPLKNNFLFNKAISLGTIDALNTVIDGVGKIKWPNDLYYGNKKIGGILIENIIRGQNISDSVVGIGVNVNQETFDPYLNNATSITNIKNASFNLEELLETILNHISIRYEQLKLNLYEQLNRDYLTLLKNYNENIFFIERDEKKSGVLLGVNHEGEIIIRTNEKLAHYKHQEIQFI